MPAAALTLPLPLRGRDKAGLLSDQRDLSGQAETELSSVSGDGWNADLEPELVEERVARTDNGLVEIEVSPIPVLPVFEAPLPQLKARSATQPVEGRDDPLLERRGGDDDLEQRPRRILTLDRPIQERVLGVLHQAEPHLPLQVAREGIQREGRARGHGEKVPAPGIQHHHRPRVFAHGLLRYLLDPAIHGGDHVSSRTGLLPPDHPDGTAGGVHLDLLPAILPPEVVVQQSLEPALTSQVATPVAPQT